MDIDTRNVKYKELRLEQFNKLIATIDPCGCRLTNSSSTNQQTDSSASAGMKLVKNNGVSQSRIDHLVQRKSKFVIFKNALTLAVSYIPRDTERD